MVDKKPKAAKTAYSCFIQVIRDEHKKKHPEEQINFSEFAKKCSEKWKLMNAKEKQRFKDIAAKDKERYNKEMENYTPPAGAKRKRKHKDPNEPKRAWSAFFCFSDEFRKKIRDEHPEWKVGDISKELGRRWEMVTDKSKYDELARIDKERYTKEIEEYRSGISQPKNVKAGGDNLNGDENEEDDDEEEDADDGE